MELPAVIHITFDKKAPWSSPWKTTPTPPKSVEYMRSDKIFQTLRNPKHVQAMILRGEIVLPEKYLQNAGGMAPGSAVQKPELENELGR